MPDHLRTTRPAASIPPPQQDSGRVLQFDKRQGQGYFPPSQATPTTTAPVTGKPATAAPAVTAVPDQEAARFAAGDLTMADMTNEKILLQLQGMGVDGLTKYLAKVKDPDVKRLIQAMSAKIKWSDSKLQAETLDRLEGYIGALIPRMKTVLDSPGKEFKHLQKNPTVQKLIQNTEHALADMQAGLFTVRFDPTLSGKEAAKYDYSKGVMRLRPFQSDAELAEVVPLMIHEYMHFQDDQATEQEVATTHQPKEHTAKDEVTREVKGRQSQVYMAQVLQSLGDIKADDYYPGKEDDLVFTGRFENERKGTGPGKKPSTKEIRKSIALEYSAQIAKNTPAVTLYAFIDKGNHLQIQLSKVTHDLGQVPATDASPSKLAKFAETQIDQSPDKLNIFDKIGHPGKSEYHKATVLIFRDGVKVTEFSMAPK